MQDLQFKANPGTYNIDEMQGIVECFVAAVGNKDSVGDVVLPGAFNGSLRRRKPRVVWGHDWNAPIGKVLDIYEVGSTDPRLPDKMRQAGVGGVYARVQFNLKSERGREAFNSVMFFGEEQEWSIGYKTLDSIYSQEQQANLLKEVELYEVSPVLHGANQLTATISIKSEQQESPVDSFRKSKWTTFDPAFAEMIRTKHPEIWKLGGNIKGNDQYRALKPIHDRGGKAASEAEINALELREAWVARHHKDFRPAGVMAQIKWLAVGSRGEAYMKDVIRKEIAKRSPGEKTDDTDLDVKAHNRDDADNADLARALGAHFGGPVKLRSVSANLAVFDVVRDGEPETMRVAYHHEGAEYMFGDADEVTALMVYVDEEAFEDGDEEDDEDDGYTNEPGNNYRFGPEAQAEKEPMDVLGGLPMGMTRRIMGRRNKPGGGCGCGCGGGKSDDADVDTKVGRVLSNRTLDKLRQALTLLQEVLASGSVDMEMKAFTVPALADEIKSIVDPIAEFYGIRVDVEDFGIKVAGFDAIPIEAKSALGSALQHVTSDNSFVIIDTEPAQMMALKSLIDSHLTDAVVIIDENEGEWLAVQAKTSDQIAAITSYVAGSGIQVKGYGIGELEYDCGCK